MRHITVSRGNLISYKVCIFCGSILSNEYEQISDEDNFTTYACTHVCEGRTKGDSSILFQKIELMKKISKTG